METNVEPERFGLNERLIDLKQKNGTPKYYVNLPLVHDRPGTNHKHVLGLATSVNSPPANLLSTLSYARKAEKKQRRKPTCLMCVSRPFWCMATTQICKKCARSTGPSDPPAASAAIAAGPPAPGANSGTRTHPRGSCSSFTWRKP